MNNKSTAGGINVDSPDEYNKNKLKSKTDHVTLGTTDVPLKLLHEHAEGRVLFICGAGVSVPSDLPDFEYLIRKIYQEKDEFLFKYIENNTLKLTEDEIRISLDLTVPQKSELIYFLKKEYDHLIGHIETRFPKDQIREVVCQILSKHEGAHLNHKLLLKLSDQIDKRVIATTNFDLLFEDAAKIQKLKIPSYSLGGMPRPSKGPRFSGIMHLHGALPLRKNEKSELVLSHIDFGEYYFSRNVVPNFIFNAARIYTIVLVGYRANDPPMRYLFNAVSSDKIHIEDTRGLYIILPDDDADEINRYSWIHRGFETLSYKKITCNDKKVQHQNLTALLQDWHDISEKNENRVRSKLVNEIFSKKFSEFNDSDKNILRYILDKQDDFEFNILKRKFPNLKTPDCAQFIVDYRKQFSGNKRNV